VRETGAKAVYWNRCYEPWRRRRDEEIKAGLKADGVEAHSFNGSLLAEPWELKTGAGDPYKVFTPFWKALKERVVDRPLAAPKQLSSPASLVSDDLKDWDLEPKRPDWAGGLRATWAVGEGAAADRLTTFLHGGLRGYGNDRNRPDRPSTSRLSADLHWGHLSPRQVWHATLAHLEQSREGDSDGWKFLSELAWREFSYHLLFHWPDLPDKNWRQNFDDFPWRRDDEALSAWQRGRTGYPIVDAGMRELWRTGWMHNRVRMVVASFLVKHLLLPWQTGEAWFWDTLVDADLANNAASWQWVAGSGADAAPYFRIFNPVIQGERFDPDGTYVRTWIPEIERLPAARLHRPWTASREELSAAGVKLGEDYPAPIVDHAAARQRALAAFEEIKKGQA